MLYKIAAAEEIKDIYNTYMKKDFPPAELKPLEAILYSVENGWYKMYIGYDEGGIKGYACIADCSGGANQWGQSPLVEKIGFLDYFAIVKEYRGTGFGSEFFKALGEFGQFDVIILETESIESAKNEEEDFIRRRRIAFYKRSGCMDTGCMYNVFGVEYNVFINHIKAKKLSIIKRTFL